MHPMALTLRTDEELEQALTELAESQGLSRQEVIRRAVLDMRDRTGHRARVAEASRRMREQYAEALDRLGSV
jgi:predicted transcriptional regulator